MLNILVMFVTMFALMFLGVEVFLSMGIAAVAYLLLSRNAPLTLIPTSMVNGISASSLLAIPFFILAGEFMNKSGITMRLVKFAQFFIGEWKGGLAYAVTIVNMIVAGVSGSAPADCSAVSSVLLKPMREEGYPDAFSGAINAASATIGPIIPPSIPMVEVSLLTGLSVGKLFLGGFIPGVLMGLSLMAVSFFKVRKMDLPPAPSQEHSLKAFWKLLKYSWLALIAPLIIIIGVISGFVTITEVSILATAYVLFIGVVVYRTIKVKEIFGIFRGTVVFASTIMALFSVASIFAWFIAIEGLGAKLGAYIIAVHLTPLRFLLFANLLFIFLGCIMDAVPAMIIFLPVLLPIALTLGIDPIHFCVIVVVNLMIGLLTPPVGGLLYVEAKLAKVPVDKLIKELIPDIIVLFSVTALITLLPKLVTFVPGLFF